MTVEKQKRVALSERGHRIGETHHRAKLTDHEVDLVFELLEAGLSPQVIAEKMEVSRWTIRRYQNGERRGQMAFKFKIVRI